MRILTGILAALPFAVVMSSAMVQAQTVPGIGAELPPVNLMSQQRVPLDDKEAHGLSLANEWMNNPDRPRRGADGSVRYLYGATLPTLVCTPHAVCVIRLQPGEIVNDVHAADTARWRITPATQGVGGNSTTMVVVKPTDAGLTANLFISTDRRAYTIKLVSTQEEWIPVLSFDYPDDIQREWADYQRHQQQVVQDTTLPTGQSLLDLDFGFRIGGDRPAWAPLRVYTDGSKTYIEFSSTNFGGEAPALVALGPREGLFSGPSQELINYRVVGSRYVVDQVIDRAALITGVGRQQTRVTIERGR